MSRLSLQHTVRSIRSVNQSAIQIRSFSAQASTESATAHPKSTSRNIMDYLTEHGPQTRRSIFAHFGSGAEPMVRSKAHLTLLLRKLTASGRVLAKPAPAETRRASSLYVYEMRDYSRSFNRIRAEHLQAIKAGKSEADARAVEEAIKRVSQ